MNIYLSSYGIDPKHNKNTNCYAEIVAILKNKKVAIIPNARLVS